MVMSDKEKQRLIVRETICGLEMDREFLLSEIVSDCGLNPKSKPDVNVVQNYMYGLGKAGYVEKRKMEDSPRNLWKRVASFSPEDILKAYKDYSKAAWLRKKKKQREEAKPNRRVVVSKPKIDEVVNRNPSLSSVESDLQTIFEMFAGVIGDLRQIRESLK